MPTIASLDAFDRWDPSDQGDELRVHKVDLGGRTEVLLQIATRPCHRAAFLGCVMDERAESELRKAGALVLSVAPELPFDPYRLGLYTSAELLDGVGELPYEQTMDARVRDWAREAADAVGVRDGILKGLHDSAMTAALHEYVAGKRIVGIMGGHSLMRGTDGFADAARLGRTLARGGLVVGTEGGPGAMEAANLGAYLADADDEVLDKALGILAAVPDVEAAVTDWARSAFEVRGLHPAGVHSTASLGVAPWTNVYGEDPANAFVTVMAKFLTRTLEDFGVLGLANAGLVFLPGAAGTVQEIFEAAMPSYYTDGPIRPIILVGKEHWTAKLPAWDLLDALGKGRRLGARISLVDDVESAAVLLREAL
ncbi:MULTISPECIES: Rossmann fold nucleotide-binding protein [unclassified Streptomyces]|uniref:Rossmann fold nucleotide-binding protein n=1 Tax=unclassified Streptomyces TaxID=2593676 RepID=UPI0032462D60